MKRLIKRAKAGDDTAVTTLLTIALATVVTLLAALFITMANLYGMNMAL